MDQAGTAGAGEQPAAAAGDEPAKRIVGGGDAPAAGVATTGGGCFDCNICLECAAEPVVTLCGHLYCWPCIYEWLRPDADAGTARRRCPVCKAAASPDALVPLYGRGGSSRAKKPPRGLAGSIPRRPALRRRVKTATTAAATTTGTWTPTHRPGHHCRRGTTPTPRSTMPSSHRRLGTAG